jgi:hypothetical protein
LLAFSEAELVDRLADMVKRGPSDLRREACVKVWCLGMNKINAGWYIPYRNYSNGVEKRRV